MIQPPDSTHTAPSGQRVKLLPDFAEQIETCTSCMLCSEVCPMVLATGKDVTGPNGKILAARAILEGEPLTGELYDSIYQSTRCKACEDICPSGIKITDIIQALRHDMILENREPVTHTKNSDNISKHGNPPGLPGGQRLANMDLPELRSDSEYLYLTGCWLAYKTPQIVQDTMDILNHAGVDYTMLGREELCCGIFQIDTGHLEEARELAKKNIELIESTKTKTIVTSCPSCANVYENLYPKLYRKPGFKTTTIPQLFHKLLKEGKLRLAKSLDQTLTYKDPCHLGRTGSHYTEPRELIVATGAKLVEMADTREQAICCAAPAGIKARYPEITDAVEKHILREAKNTGATAMVTSCPFCNLNFSSIDSDLRVVDISQLIRSCMV